jgi:GTP diphosphokinase / guanosine-3',5'-bis(diphosphate) 3'-diphosphatase
MSGKEVNLMPLVSLSEKTPVNMLTEVKQAYEIAARAHEGQKRKSGEPYISHCLEVERIIREEWGLERDKNLRCAALLHDVVEDTELSLQDIRTWFGEDVENLVYGVTHFKSESSDDPVRKVASTSYFDPRVLLLKLSDRVNNMRTLGYMSADRRKAKAEETIGVYTRMAESLGLWVVKTELEDLCFEHLNPKDFERIKKEVSRDPRLNELFLGFVSSNLERFLMENKIHGSVSYRRSGYWALKEKRLKMSLRGTSSTRNLNHINDVISFRVQVNTVEDCYKFLGVLHQELGAQVDYDRFDEFMGANARVNGYEALQTTLNLPQGAVEIAVATYEQENFNQWGVISVIRDGKGNPGDYVRKLVFIQTGEARFLPPSATAIDLAYLINPSLAAAAQFALIDGKRSPLSAVIPNSSKVQIVFGQPKRAPDSALLQYCLPNTRKKIENQIIQKQRDETIHEGQKIIEGMLIKLGLPNFEDIPDLINPLMYNLNCETINDIHFKIGGGFLTTDLVVRQLSDLGISKEKLMLTTLRIAGKDQPGILEDLASWITGRGGNVSRLSFNNGDKQYYLRIVIEKFGLDDEEWLKEILHKDNRFKTWSVS